MTQSQNMSHVSGAPGNRILGPDLARGFMLLLIVLANTPYYLFGGERAGASAHPLDGSTLDAVVQGILITTVDMRVYPMFAFLFGYGLVMIGRRQAAKGLTEKQARRIVQVRNLWLLGFGFIHALLLWGGDVLGAYGLTGIILVWLFLRRSDRTILIWAAIGAGLVTVLALLSALEAVAVMAGAKASSGIEAGFVNAIYDSTATTSYLDSIADRMTIWPILIVAVQGIFGLVVPASILLGFWAARHRILERPQHYRKLLWAIAIGGIGIGWSVGLFNALAHTGRIASLEDAADALAAPQLASGLACGLGYVALFGLFGGWLSQRRRNPMTNAVVAVGKRSMTCYLAQSVLCAPVLAGWGFGLGGVLGSAGMAAYAVGVWLMTVVLAVVLEKRNQPGPAETLLRRLTYGPAAVPSRA